MKFLVGGSLTIMFEIEIEAATEAEAEDKARAMSLSEIDARSSWKDTILRINYSMDAEHTNDRDEYLKEYHSD